MPVKNNELAKAKAKKEQEKSKGKVFVGKNTNLDADTNKNTKTTEEKENPIKKERISPMKERQPMTETEKPYDTPMMEERIEKSKSERPKIQVAESTVRDEPRANYGLYRVNESTPEGKAKVAKAKAAEMDEINKIQGNKIKVSREGGEREVRINRLDDQNSNRRK